MSTPGRRRMCPDGTKPAADHPVIGCYGGYNMDFTALSDIVSNFGFPIAVAIAMFWYVNKQDERHREEMGEMRKTLEENTSVLSGLKDIIAVFITKMGD